MCVCVCGEGGGGIVEGVGLGLEGSGGGGNEISCDGPNEILRRDKLNYKFRSVTLSGQTSNLIASK